MNSDQMRRRLVVVLIIGALGGYLWGRYQISQRADAQLESLTSQRRDRDERLLEAFREKDRALRACRSEAVHGWRVEEASRSRIIDAYDTALRYVGLAYQYGQGGDREAAEALLRALYDSQQLERAAGGLELGNEAETVCSDATSVLGIPEGLSTPPPDPLVFVNSDEVREALLDRGIGCADRYLQSEEDYLWCLPVGGLPRTSLGVSISSRSEAAEDRDEVCRGDGYAGFVIYKEGGNWLGLISRGKGRSGLEDGKPHIGLAKSVAEAMRGSSLVSC